MARIILFILCMMMCFGNVDAGISVGGAYSVPAGASPGTVLAGDTTEYSQETLFTDPGRIYRVQYEAVATGTVANGYWRTAGDSDDSYMIIYDSSENLLAQSDLLETHPDGWSEYTFSGANQITITSGVTYGLAIFTQNYIDYYDGNSATLRYDQASWDTPSDPWVDDGGASTAAPWGCYITA